MTEQRNWAGNYAYRAARLHRPTTVAEIQELAARSRKLRVLGTRHSFNDIADTPEDLVSTEHLGQVEAIDPARRTVTVGAGIRYGQLCRELHAAGFALHNMASLPHISVAGACATATHGSGDRNGNLASAVAAVELVTADGALVQLSRERDGERFNGVPVNLGGLGVITKVTLDIVPAFEVRQYVYERLPLAELERHFDEIESSAYSVSLFTDWSGPYINQVWLKRRAGDGAGEPPAALFGASPAPADRHPIDGISAVNCTAQMGVPGPWYERLPHFRMDFTPSAGDELQTEYLLPRRHALAAIGAVAQMSAQVSPLIQTSEVRTVAADQLWMSPCYGQDCVALHFTWKPDWPAVSQLLPRIEAALAPLEARPHWGKLFSVPPEQIRALYPRLPDFQRLLGELDPQRKFSNAFLDTYIFSAAG
jgi:xylitol oxidase